MSFSVKALLVIPAQSLDVFIVIALVKVNFLFLCPHTYSPQK